VGLWILAQNFLFSEKMVRNVGGLTTPLFLFMDIYPAPGRRRCCVAAMMPGGIVQGAMLAS